MEILSWQKTYGGNLLDEAHFIQQTTDGGYIVAGDTVSFGAGSSDYWLLKLDGNGEIPDCNIAATSNVTCNEHIYNSSRNHFYCVSDLCHYYLPQTITSLDTSVVIRDACACEGDFDCDGDLDGTDASTFQTRFWQK